MATKGNHERLAERLAGILILLNQGEKLTLARMAEEFGISEKTARRDIARLTPLGLEQDTQGRHFLPPHLLGKLSRKDIERFAALTGIRGLFPSLDEDFLRTLFDQTLQQALLVKGHRYEDLSHRLPEFELLQQAVSEHRLLDFSYAKPGETKHYQGIEPYKLVNNLGIWYLSAVDRGTLKTFSLSKLRALHLRDGTFTPDPQTAQRIEQNDDIWFNDGAQEVILRVDSEVAYYFKRRNLVAQQKTVEECEDGSLVISTIAAHPLQILPIVQQWIPHVSIEPHCRKYGS